MYEIFIGDSEFASVHETVEGFLLFLDLEEVINSRRRCNCTKFSLCIAEERLKDVFDKASIRARALCQRLYWKFIQDDLFYRRHFSHVFEFRIGTVTAMINLDL